MTTDLEKSGKSECFQFLFQKYATSQVINGIYFIFIITLVLTTQPRTDYKITFFLLCYGQGKVRESEKLKFVATQYKLSEKDHNYGAITSSL